MTKLFVAIAAGLLIVSTAAQAQTATTTSGSGSSGRMWGAANASNANPIDSSLMHSQDAASAGEVNAAKAGLLYGANVNITAVGSQNIVSTTVFGNNNVTTVTPTQTSSNTGTVTNNGTIAKQP